MINITKNKGITLIALAITIIILLILAGVTINFIIGENGIMGQAQNAGKQTDIASIKEQIRIEILSKQSHNNRGYISDTDLKAILEKHGTMYKEDAMATTDVNECKYIKIKDKGYEILLADIWGEQ